jgi:Response regulator receiver domain
MAVHPKGTVLIVEDEPLIRMFIRDALEQGGYSTDEAGNAHQAMEMPENDGYKAVLTDIGMPGDLNGLDLAWAVEVRWPEIGVVVTRYPLQRTCPPTPDLLQSLLRWMCSCKRCERSSTTFVSSRAMPLSRLGGQCFDEPSHVVAGSP